MAFLVWNTIINILNLKKLICPTIFDGFVVNLFGDNIMPDIDIQDLKSQLKSKEEINKTVHRFKLTT